MLLAGLFSPFTGYANRVDEYLERRNTDSTVTRELLTKLYKINAIDKSRLNFSDRTKLHKEVRFVGEGRETIKHGSYLSFGPIIIIVLLLLLLL